MSKSVSKQRLWFTVAGVAVMAAWQPLPASAQDGTTTLLDPIIVFGERGETSILETETSVTVFDEEELERANPDSVYDLVKQAPNVTATPNDFLPPIRGVNSDGPLGIAGNDLNGTSPRLTYVVDGVSRPISYTNNSFQSVFDVEQVEVLRGPQTTLQGANALAGSIVVNTKDPVFQREGRIQSTLEYDEISDFTTRTGLMFNDVIAEDQLAYRLVLQYIDGELPIADNPAFGFGEAQREENLGSGRFKLLWEPDSNPDLSALVSFDYQQGRVPVFKSAIVNEFRQGGTQRVMDTEAWGTTADIRYQIGAGELRSISSFFSDQYESTPETTQPGVTFDDIEDTRLTQDLTYSFENVGIIEDGLIGVSLQNRQQKQRYGDQLNRQIDTDTTTGALFTKMNFALGDQWTAGVGGRLQSEKKKIDGASAFGPGPQTPVDYNETETVFLPDIGLTYSFGETQSVFVTYRKGYNPGGFGVNLFSGDPFAFDAEFSDTYEIGYRGELLDNRLVLTATAFYNEFDGYHTYVFGPGGMIDYSIINVDGKSYGAEIEARAQVTETFQGIVGVGLLRTELDAPGEAYDGNRFGDDPEFTFNIAVVWEVRPGLTFDAQANYQSSYFIDFNETGPKAGNFWNVDIGATYERDNLSVRGFVKNVFDQVQYTSRSPGGFGNVLDPRTFGATGTLRF